MHHRALISTSNSRLFTQFHAINFICKSYKDDNLSRRDYRCYVLLCGQTRERFFCSLCNAFFFPTTVLGVPVRKLQIRTFPQNTSQLCLITNLKVVFIQCFLFCSLNQSFIRYICNETKYIFANLRSPQITKMMGQTRSGAARLDLKSLKSLQRLYERNPQIKF